MFPLKGTNNYYIILDASQSSSDEESLLCCRACLTTDGRLFNIHDFKLADAFSYASGSLAVKDQLPQYLCSFCREVVLKYASFRDMCARTQQQLMTELLRGQLNTESIRKIHQTSDHLFNFTLTEVETIDCAPFITKTESADDIQELETPLEQDVINTTPVDAIKNEPNIDIVDINSIIEKTYEINKIVDKLDKYKIPIKGKYIKKEVRKIHKRRTKKDKSETELNIENESAFKNDIVVNISSLKPEPDESEDEYDYNIRQGDESNLAVKEDHIINDASDEEDVNSLIKNKKRNIRGRETNRKRQKTIWEIEKERREEDAVARNKTFESEYSVRIVFLSKEEQLAEVAARKETVNYKESIYKCQECYKGYDDKAAYENHMLRHYPTAGAYVCEICKLRFAKNHIRRTHLNVHKEKLFCTKCHFVSRTKGQAKDHHCLHAGKTFDCQHCGKSFLKKTTCLTHTRLSHPALNVACDECGEVFVGASGLRSHKAKTHSEKIQCTICSAKFVSLAALNRHTDTAGEHRDLRPCQQCGDNCASEAALQEHVTEKHPKDHRCEECSLSFPSAEAYSTHVARTHLQQRKSDHVRPAASKRKRAVLDALARAAGSSHMCEQCGRIFATGPQLCTHQRIHDEAKRYVCHDCSKAFTQKVTLVAHMRSHSGEKPFKCASCPAAFNQLGNLKRHNKTAHLGIRESYMCTICGSTTTTKSSLRVHIDSKHGGKGWPKSRKRTKYNEASQK